VLSTHWTPQVIDALTAEELARWGEILEPFYLEGAGDRGRMTTFEYTPIKTLRRIRG
jgi:hypothetical protein